MKERKKQPSLFVWQITALLSLTLFLSILWILADSLFLITENVGSVEVVIPDFCGQKEDSIGCVDEYIVLQSEYRYDREVPRGVVITQSPRAGKKQKVSSRRPVCEVTLFVSLGAEDAEE